MLADDRACRDPDVHTLIQSVGGCDIHRADVVCSAFNSHIEDCPAGRCIRRNVSDIG